MILIIPANCASAGSGDSAETLTNGNIIAEETSNAVIIPGVFQSRMRLLNDDGTPALNSDGEEYSKPFFVDSSSDIIKLALSRCLLPLLFTLITQRDYNNILAESLGSTIAEVLGKKVQADGNGKLKYNLVADKYEGSLATLTDEEKEYVYNQVPLQKYTEACGEDHLYFFSYCSFTDINDTVDELYDYIKKAAEASPTGKVNIIPISQGGSLAANLFQRHRDVGKYTDRVVFIVPALDGTVLLGELYEKGFIDDDYSLFSEIFPVLLYDNDTPYTGYLVNLALRLLPNSVVNNILDTAFDDFIGGYLKNITSLWALVPHENYPGAAEKYLSGEENSIIRAQTDEHYIAQLNIRENLLYQIDNFGVEIFDIAEYNYPLYPIVDSWKSTSGDGVIHLGSTSIGAVSFGTDVTLPDDYTPAYGGKYVDPHNLIDAGTGLLPDRTFYFYNQNHEATAHNEKLIDLAVCLITDKNFTDVGSYPDRYPQFSDVPPEEEEECDTAGRILTFVLKAASDVMYRFFRGYGYSELYRVYFD